MKNSMMSHNSHHLKKSDSDSEDNVLSLTESQIKDVARYYTNALGECCYEFASKLNHGFPTNVDMAHYHLSTSTVWRVVVFAIKDLEMGDELQFDYFDVLGKDGSRKCQEVAPRFGIDVLNQEPLNELVYRELVDELERRYRNPGE